MTVQPPNSSRRGAVPSPCATPPVLSPPPGAAVPAGAFCGERRLGTGRDRRRGSHGGGTAEGDRFPPPRGGLALAASGSCGPVEVPRETRRAGTRAGRPGGPAGAAATTPHPGPGALRAPQGHSGAGREAAPAR